MTLAKPMIPNVRLHDGVKPMTFSDVGRKHAADAAITRVRSSQDIFAVHRF